MYHLSHIKVKEIEDDINLPLTFLAIQPSTITLVKNGSINIDTLMYKKNNGEWTNYILNTEISLNTGESIQFRNTTNTLSTSNSNYVNFSMTGKILAYHNIQSLLNFRNDNNVPNYGYRRLFQNCLSLIKAPLLPAITVGYYSYGSMFGKTNVSNVITMSGTTFDQYACFYMFELAPITKAPEILATSIDGYSFDYMFNNCKQLITPPSQILVTNMKRYGCSYMFNGCSALTSVPRLNATSLLSYCFNNMFNGCSSLTTVPTDLLPVTTLKEGCYGSMFLNCSNLINAPLLPAPVLVSKCYNNMFSGCKKINEITVRFTEWVSNCTNYWVSNVNKSGTFICPNGLDTTLRDNSHIPTSWNIYHPIFT